VQSVDDNILRDLAHKLPFGSKKHKIGLEMAPVKMAKKRYKHAFRATCFHGANEKNNFLAMICIHYLSIYHVQAIAECPLPLASFAIGHLTDEESTTADDDRGHGMAISWNMVDMRANRSGLRRRVSTGIMPALPSRASAATTRRYLRNDLQKGNAAEEGFNRWTINGAAYPMANEKTQAPFSSKARPAISDAQCQ